MQQSAVHIDEYIITERLIAGDPRTQERVYDHYGPALYSIILQVVGDTGKAEDVLTKVFVRVFKNIHEYKASGNTTLFGWMMRVAREMAVQEAVEAENNPLGNEIVKADSSLLQRFSNKLPAQKRTIFHLCYYKGLPKEAVARILGIQPDEVMNQLRDIMVEFRKFLGE
ncbi:RNA polymerase sigma-70 factor, ECF subfamily [Chitinophaga sp. YR627]|uniref:RNA polymerase sigma factor n=1 Tax=Chitinophaga sp. YR627 TaxID=1881041 RepID=UPI0008E3AADF|nr:sigma-70 family RNA polymerase sigma factor [Chitinophaga sp. YR627]SFN85365.1 RNA polymerase sigma-70 factor, ECF subfamily [Chitinophaga sp. YR627]